MNQKKSSKTKQRSSILPWPSFSSAGPSLAQLGSFPSLVCFVPSLILRFFSRSQFQIYPLDEVYTQIQPSGRACGGLYEAGSTIHYFLFRCCPFFCSSLP